MLCLPQGEADDLTQRCTQLHNENTHLASMLAQRDNELQGERCRAFAWDLLGRSVRQVACVWDAPKLQCTQLELTGCLMQTWCHPAPYAELEQTIEEKDGQLAAQKEAADKLAGGRQGGLNGMRDMCWRSHLAVWLHPPDGQWARCHTLLLMWQCRGAEGGAGGTGRPWRGAGCRHR